VELRADGDDDGRVVFNVTVAGRPAEVDVLADARPEGSVDAAPSRELQSLARLRSVTVRLSSPEVRAVKVWLHRVTPDGRSEGLGGRVTVDGGEPRSVDERSGQVILPLDGGGESIEIVVSSIAPAKPAGREE
jgi:hypothetical protein